MGRLFWKFFVLILLVQLAGVAATGAVFWVERNYLFGAGGQSAFPPPSHDHPPPPPPEFGGSVGLPPPHPGGPHRPPPKLPWVPMGIALLVSLGSAALLAAYVARPIRRLRSAFDALTLGQLDTRVGAAMGRRNDELAALGKDFDRMAARLEALVTGQRRLLHDVSHELRSPLARLQAALGLIGQDPGKTSAMLARLERECVRMDRLVGELLTLSRLNAGETGPLEVIDLGEILHDIVEDAQFEAADRQLSVVLNGADQPVWVFGNSELLHRAIDNVLRNALRHSPVRAEVRIEVGTLSRERCRVSISDQGRGVPEALREKIFQPFFRAEDESTGYGLGLAIARRALAAVNAEIRAKRAASGGLLVEIDLEAANQAATSTGATKT